MTAQNNEQMTPIDPGLVAFVCAHGHSSGLLSSVEGRGTRLCLRWPRGYACSHGGVCRAAVSEEKQGHGMHGQQFTWCGGGGGMDSSDIDVAGRAEHAQGIANHFRLRILASLAVFSSLRMQRRMATARRALADVMWRFLQTDARGDAVELPRKEQEGRKQGD